MAEPEEAAAPPPAPEPGPLTEHDDEDEPPSFHLVPYKHPKGGAIYIGSIPNDRRAFDITGAKAVVNLSGLAYRFDFPEGVNLHKISMGDHGEPPSEARIAAGVEFVGRHLAEGDVVFIHCKLGQSRSAWFIMTYLKRSGADYKAIWKELLELRPGVKNMVPGFQADLGLLVAEGSKRIRKPIARLSEDLPEVKRKSAARGRSRGGGTAGKRGARKADTDTKLRPPLAPKRGSRKTRVAPQQTTTTATTENE